MIYFNNVALESVAPVMVEDIRISPIQRTATARQRPIAAGADFVRIADGSRTVTISFGLLIEDIDARQNALTAITRWAATQQEGKLVLPHRDGRYLSCICTNLPEPSMRQWWESRLSLVFTTFDNPYFTDISEKAVGCGEQLIASGDAVPLMRITDTVIGTETNVTFSNGHESMTFSEIPEGELVIDLNRQTAAVDGESIMTKWVFGSDFVIPCTGAQTIEGRGVVRWRERWQG